MIGKSTTLCIAALVISFALALLARQLFVATNGTDPNPGSGT